MSFYQIYYDYAQRSELYPFAIPYKNESLTPFFENTVISDIVSKDTDSDILSVCSWRLRAKRGDCPIQLQGRNLTEEAILSSDFDVAILTPRSPRHKPLLMASHWHGKAWDDAIADLRKFMHVPKELTNTIYENHFIARREIYQQYVYQCLNPVMDYMRGRDVYFTDSGYVAKVRRNTTKVEAMRKALGRDDWPIAPFVLERLFSIWIEGKGFKVTIL